LSLLVSRERERLPAGDGDRSLLGEGDLLLLLGDGDREPDLLLGEGDLLLLGERDLLGEGDLLLCGERDLLLGEGDLLGERE